jgi:hypothetical protein
LFLPGTHEVRERLLPVISLWLDSLILRLITQTDGARPPVWIVLDELASLQKLPQLATALAEGRKANVRLLRGFQGRSQMEARYGAEAETMLSQPITKIFLRTSEPRAAEWISKAIGEVEIERLRVSHTKQRGLFGLRNRSRDTHTSQIEQKTEPLVMASVIGGLPRSEWIHQVSEPGGLGDLPVHRSRTPRHRIHSAPDENARPFKRRGSHGTGRRPLRYRRRLINGESGNRGQRARRLRFGIDCSESNMAKSPFP